MEVSGQLHSLAALQSGETALSNHWIRSLGGPPRHERIRESGGIDPPFLTSALDGREWSASRSGRFTYGERFPGTYWVGGWVDPRAGLGYWVKE
jgi:hypothetical protein